MTLLPHRYLLIYPRLIYIDETVERVRVHFMSYFHDKLLGSVVNLFLVRESLLSRKLCDPDLSQSSMPLEMVQPTVRDPKTPNYAGELRLINH